MLTQNSAQQITPQRLDAVVASLDRFIEHARFALSIVWSEIPPGTKRDILDAWRECVIQAARANPTNFSEQACDAADRIYDDISKRDILQIPIQHIEAGGFLGQTAPERIKGMIEGVVLAELIRQ